MGVADRYPWSTVCCLHALELTMVALATLGFILALVALVAILITIYDEW